MKKYFIYLVTLILTIRMSAQDENANYISMVEQQLEILSAEIPGLSEQLDIKTQRTSLSTFLISISQIHNINIDTNPQLASIEINNSFKNVSVKDVLIYLCKIYKVDIDFSGSILYFKPYKQKVEDIAAPPILIDYEPNNRLLSLDLTETSLPEVLKKISNLTGKGLFYTPQLSDKLLSGYINKLPLELALEKLAFSNNLLLTKTKEGIFEFTNQNITSANNQTSTNSLSRPSKSRRSNFFFNVISADKKTIEVDFTNVPIQDIIYDLSAALKVDIFLANPLIDAGVASVKAKNITYDKLLTKLFENQEVVYTNTNNTDNLSLQQKPNTTKRFTWKKDNDIYYFGTQEQFVLRNSELVQLKNRSIVILTDPEAGTRRAGRTVGINSTFGNGGFNSINPTSNRNTTNNNLRNRSTTQSNIKDNLKEIIPKDIQKDLEITIDEELNGFIVSGPSNNINRFKEFVAQIDKRVPLVVIEVMILETNKNSSLDLGVEWGIADQPTTTQGQIYPSTNFNLGANTINRILGRIDGSSFFNIGKVVPNFYANIRASEANGSFQIKDSPRITTLNGHRASFSNGQTSYYAVTSQTFIGSQNPATSEIVNYQPIDAELSLEVKPFVSLDGEITMDVRVIQSNFNGERIADDAPPGLNSRELTSIVRARSNDIIVLGGLESRARTNSGTGVPFLARIPLLKYLFSKRTRTASKSKLSILIKPTVFY